MGLFSKNQETVPPDVGKEEEYEAQLKAENKEAGEEEEKLKELPEEKFEAVPASYNVKSIEIEKLTARVEAIYAWIKEFYERFSNISERIGEIRAMNLENERQISNSMKEAARAVDIVREVKPEKLRMDYKKSEARIDMLGEKIDANKQFTDTIMEELKELKRKAEVFSGTETVLKLNEEIKKDLIEIQKLGSITRLHADKVEQIFIEMRRGFTEYQKINAVISNLDASYSGLKGEIEKLKIDYSDILNKKDFDDFKKTFNNKFAIVENYLSDIDDMKKENESMNRAIETAVSIAEDNKRDIGDIAVTIGDDKIKRVSDYENQLASILRIIDTLAGQIASIKKKVGMEEKKISVDEYKKEVIGKKKINLKNVEVHPEISKHFISKKPEIPKTIKKLAENSTEAENKAEDESD
jgi:chromosome segregation ATPase